MEPANGERKNGNPKGKANTRSQCGTGKARLKPGLFARELALALARGHMAQNASQLAYSLLMAFIPLLLFLFAIASRLALPYERLLEGLAWVLPAQSYKMLEYVLFKVQSSGISTVTLLGALAFVASGIRGLMAASDSASGIAKSRGPARIMASSLALSLLLVTMLSAALVLGVFGQFVFESVGRALGLASGFLSQFARYGLLFLFASPISCILYYFCRQDDSRLSQQIPGALVFSVGWLGLSAGFAFYVEHFASYDAFFGPLGGVFILFAWLYYTSFLLIAGAHANAICTRLAKDPQD